MAIHVWSLLCRKSVIDKEDNTLSIIDVYEAIRIQKDSIEAFISSANVAEEKRMLEEAEAGERLIFFGQGNEGAAMTLVSTWWREDKSTPESPTARLNIFNPSGKSALQHEFIVDLTQSHKNRTMIKFPAVPYQGIGIYKYSIERKIGTEKNPKWETVSEILFEIEGKKFSEELDSLQIGKGA